MQFPLEVHENLNKVLLQFTELSRRRLLKTGNDQDNKRITGLSARAKFALRDLEGMRSEESPDLRVSHNVCISLDLSFFAEPRNYPSVPLSR